MSYYSCYIHLFHLLIKKTGNLLFEIYTIYTKHYENLIIVLKSS